ncbi:MAG: sensor histidine kinase [Chitinophagaceae bacterium]
MNAQKIIQITSDNIPLQVAQSSDILVDSFNAYSSNNISSATDFKPNHKNVPIYLLPNNKIWVRFYIKNESSGNNIFLSLQYPNISYVNFYKASQSGELYCVASTGNLLLFNHRTDDNINFNFPLNLPLDSTGLYYLQIESRHPVELPLLIYNTAELNKANQAQILIIGTYTGIILSILLYNLFLFFAVKDVSYIVYVSYLILLLFALLTYSGWSFKFLWPNHPQFNNYAVVITSSLPGIPALIFALVFLHVKKYSKILSYLFYASIAMYLLILIFCFSIPINISYSLLNYTGLIAGFLALISSAYISRKGYRPANYYFIAWFIFALGRQIHSLTNLGILPYNTFTSYILYTGSAVETILLSLALADKINVLQKERNLSQAEALKVSQENEKLIKEQNVILEEKVTERTVELQSTNHQLNQTLSDLKDTQTQLVEAEKMASLGQLTAGVAHEINNPINFVKSNIKPLQLDINDLFEIIDEYNHLHTINNGKIETHLQHIDELKKDIDLDYVRKEIYNLMKGIEEGADRTAEIVRGLRTFSRLDESELKVVNIHGGIDSTLVLLRNNLPHFIKIIKHYNAKGNIECYPGKLNQVFMNIVNNAIQAINSKPEMSEEEYINITTTDINDQHIEIRISDTGIGMTEEIKQKIFEPFFTTKDVGEGTGLGMAIVFKIIEKHNGKITIHSSPGNGAEFILTLPTRQPIS